MNPKKSPEQVAHELRKRTQSDQPVGAASHDGDRLYSRRQYLKDKELKHTSIEFEKENKAKERARVTPSEFERIGDLIVDYSMDMNNLTFSGFFRATGITPTVVLEQLHKNPELKRKYELARVNLAYNNEKRLEKKLQPHFAAKVCQFQSQFDPIRQRDRRSEKRFDERNKISVMRKLINERKELVESTGDSKVSYELIYDGKVVDL
jgi:hypothetical protein